MSTQGSPAILTIGHSTHVLEEFVSMLRSHAVSLIVDIRTIPKSHHNPQFNRETIAESLKREGICYLHMPGLGGLRHANRESVNTAWRNASFRGFADYMLTPEFEKNVETLIETAGKTRLALMCAEAVPWRCHRSLIADALLCRGIPVEHIMTAAHRQIHVMTPWAKVEGTRIFYPGYGDGHRMKEPASRKSVR